MKVILIHGRPVPKARPRHRGSQAFTPERTVKWERDVTLQAAASKVRVRDVELSVEIEFVTLKPLRGDLDNYAKSVLDALQKARVYENDNRISRLLVTRSVGDYDVTTIRLEERS